MTAWESLNLKRYLNYINGIINDRGQFNIAADEPYEVHHIKLRSFGGLPKKISHKTRHENLIWLTLAEHFEAHKILALDNLANHKVVYAYMMLANFNGMHLTNGRDYAIVRKAFIEHDRRINTGKPSKMRGHKYSEAVKKLISERTKLAMQRPDVRENIAKGNNNKNKRIPWNFGKQLTAETRHKLSIAHKGKKLSKAHKLHIGLAGKNRVVTEATRKKIRESQAGEKSAHNIKVICLDTGKIYFNAKAAALDNKCNYSNLVQVCRKKRKSVNNLHFAYYKNDKN